MAAKYETAEDGSCVYVKTTFAERKAARKAEQGRKYRFRVVSEYTHVGFVAGTFDSRREAEAFVNEPVGLGYTRALLALSAAHPNQHIVYGRFSVQRVEVK